MQMFTSSSFANGAIGVKFNMELLFLQKYIYETKNNKFLIT